MTSERLRFWNNVFEGVSLEPRQDVSLAGSSGYTHNFPIVAYSSDEKNIALVVPQPDPVKAVLIANDIRAVSPELNISIVRPTLADTKQVLRRAVNKYFELSLSGESIPEYLSGGLKSFTAEMEEAKKRISGDDAAILDPIQLLEITKGTLFEDLFRAIAHSREITGIYLFENFAQVTREFLTFDLPKFVELDKINLQAIFDNSPQTREIQHGVCSLPLYDFSEQAWGVLLNQEESTAATAILKDIGFHQFFRPPVDHTALALIDRGVKSEDEILRVVESTDKLGHLHSAPELLAAGSGFESLFENLKQKGLTVGGSYELELTREGKAERLSVQFQPREALFFKMLQQIPYLKEIVTMFKGT